MKIRLLIARFPVLPHRWITGSVLLPLLFLLSATQPSPGQTDGTLMIGGHQVHPTRILARYKDGIQIQAAEGTLSQAGAKVERRYQRVPRLVVLEDSDVSAAGATTLSLEARQERLQNRIQNLKDTGLFEYVEPDYIVRADLVPSDDYFATGLLWGLRNTGQNGGRAGADISATTAWDITTGSNQVIVAVIDTGIRYTHYDLTNQMWRNPNPGSYPNIEDDLFGINAVNGTGDPFDDADHGTHVSGTIGAAADDGNPLVGVTWNVRLMACKFLAANGFGSTADAITCIDYAIFNGAQVMNNSWGGGGYSQALYDVIYEAYQAGILFVAAAGNDGLDNDQEPHYPSSYTIPNILSVAAVDRNDRLADFSNYGRTSVHLGAPGVDILSSTSGSDTEYQSFNGTSMATPHVAGVAALVLSHFPAADLNEVMQRILLGTVPIPSLDRLTTTGGRLNAFNSLTIAGSGIIQATIDPPSDSVLLAESEQPIFVRLTDLFGVYGATVTASIAGVTNLTLLDDGLAPDAVANDSVYSAMFQVPASTNPLTMTVVSTAAEMVGATNVVFYDVLPPPPNDHFTNAIKVAAAGGIYRANNRFGTKESGEPAILGRTSHAASLWWTWSPAVSTNAFVDTTGSSIDSVLAVYTGNTLTNLTLIAQTNSNVAQHRRAFLSFNAQAGTAYRIVVASASTNSLGTVQLRVAPGGQPDTTPPIVAILNPLHGATLTNNQIVISGTATDPAPNATGLDEVLVRVNDLIAGTATGTTNWSAPALLKPGLNNVQVQAIDKAGNNSSLVTIQVNYLVPPPPNDIFVNAATLSGTNETVSVFTGNATTEQGEPFHGGNSGGKSVWWKFTPATDGVLTLDTTGSGFDTLLGVYTGNTVGQLALVASNDDAFDGVPGGASRIVQGVRSNVTYRIALDGYDNIGGAAQLSFSFEPGTVYTVAVSSTAGGSVPAASFTVQSNSLLTLSATPQEYFRFQNWDGSLFSLSNPLSLVVTGDMSLTAHFLPVEFSDGFESGNLLHLNWGTGGAKPWVVQTGSVAAGQFAARSGAITHNQTSSLVLTSNFRAGTGSFEYRVSSEPTFDHLRFYVDGALRQTWSGTVGWASYSFSLNTGAHTLEWRYTKDGSGSVGMDAGFIDNVNLPFVLVPDATTPANLSLIRQSDGSYYIELIGQVNQEYILQSSTNLFDWEGVSTHIAVGGVVQIPIPLDGSSGTRYYRAVVTF